MVICYQDVQQLIQLHEQRYYYQLRGQTFVSRPHYHCEQEEGDVEGGPVEQIGQAEQGQDHQHDFSRHLYHYLYYTLARPDAYIFKLGCMRGSISIRHNNKRRSHSTDRVMLPGVSS